MRTVGVVVVLVALATVVAAFAIRLRVPAPSLLVAVGLVIGLFPAAPVVHVPPAVVSLVVLPPLLYAASEELAWRDLRAVWRPVVVLAVGLVIASAAAVAAVAGAVASLSASMAFVLGDNRAAPDELIDRLRASLQSRIGTTRARIDQGPDAAGEALTERELRGDLISAESAELSRLYDTGAISAATRRRLQHSLDLETTRLTEGQQ